MTVNWFFSVLFVVCLFCKPPENAAPFVSELVEVCGLSQATFGVLRKHP